MAVWPVLKNLGHFEIGAATFKSGHPNCNPSTYNEYWYCVYLVLTSLISFTLEKTVECCVLSITWSESGLVGSIFGSSIKLSINVARLR